MFLKIEIKLIITLLNQITLTLTFWNVNVFLHLLLKYINVSICRIREIEFENLKYVINNVNLTTLPSSNGYTNMLLRVKMGKGRRLCP